MTEHRTEYRVLYLGQECLVTGRRDTADLYVGCAFLGGKDPKDYTIEHRRVTVEEWHPTTPAPATVDAIRAAR